MKNLGKVFAVASLCFVVIGIILALVLVPKKQETRSKAAFTARLYFNPNSSLTAPIQVQKGSSVSVDLMLDPGTSTVSFTRFYVNYDATKLTYNTISINTNAFPVTLEGPVQSSGLIAGAVSIGSDATRAITTPTVVATITFTASNSTTTPTQLTFGAQSMVLSIGSDSQSNENVLSTTSPAFITINEPPTPIPTSTPIPTATPTPRPTNTPLPTSTPTPLPTATPTPLPTNTPLPTATPTPRPTNTPLPTATPTPLPTSTPLPTATPRPTNTPTPVPSATPIPHTFIAYNVFLHGLGNSGDNANPTAFSLSNKNPLRPQKDFGVQIFDNLNVQIASYSGVITYNSTTGTFVGSIDLGTNIANGVYLLKVKSSQYLRSQYDSLIALVPGQTVTLPDITLVAGDTNNDNQLSILDYNMIYGCYATPLFPTPRSCDSVRNLMADINDDGAINQYDYNLFVRELSVQTGR